MATRVNTKKQTALITGASSGIGLDLAKSFAHNGYDLVLVARSKDKLEALGRELGASYGVQTRSYSYDLTKVNSPQALFDELMNDGVVVDVVVNNAGFGFKGPFVDSGLDVELSMIDLNIRALTELTYLFVKPMVERGQGHVLNIASTAAFQPGPWMSVYCATKAYVLSFGEGLSHELLGTGVTVTTHCPGATQTGFADRAGNSESLVFRAGVMDSQSVAEDAFNAMTRGKVVRIAGLMNRLSAFGVRFMPRAFVRAFAARLMK
ncbi:MAG: SDR family oxidoreductase [Polyangiales bacterium]